MKCPKVGTENADRDSLLPNMWYDFKAVRKGVIDARNADDDNPPIIIEHARTLTAEEKKQCRRGYFVNTQGNTVRMADDDAAPFINIWEVGFANENIC